MKVIALKDGKEVPLPEGIETVVIETSKGGIYIDLAGMIPDIVFVRAVETDAARHQPGRARLIMSPETGRMSLGVIRA